MTLDDIKARCDEVGDCWRWAGAVSSNGYPITKAAGVRSGCLLVRRLAVELDGRPAKPRQPVLAECDDKLCCNPECLRPSTTSAVAKRAAKKGAFSSLSKRSKIAGTQRESGKLTMEQALEIRYSTESGPVLSAKHGVHRSTINNIKRGEAWRDYSSPFAGLMG